MKKLLTIVLASALMLSLAACGGEIQQSSTTTTPTTTTTATTTTDENGETVEVTETVAAKQIIIGESMQYVTLDPAYAYEGDADIILHAAYDNLVAASLEDESVIEANVATDWDISDDGLTYVFTLRDDVVFTTGATLNADDVAFCLNRVKGVVGNPSFLMDSIDSVEATGEFEVTITLNTPNPALLTILARPTFGIYDSEMAIANGATTDTTDSFQTYCDNNPTIGSGEYQITSYQSGNSVVLDKFAGSVLTTANIDRVIVTNMADASAQQMAIQAGDIDFALDLTADQTALLANTEGVTLLSSNAADIFFLALNNDAEVGKELADPTVREAIAYAINYDAMTQMAGNGAFVPTGIIPAGFVGYAGESEITRDLDKAKELLAQAGYPDGFEFDCGVIPDMAPSGVSFMDLAILAQADLAEVGITMNIISQDVTVYLEGYRNGTQQAVMSQWGPDYIDSNNQLAFLPGNSVGLRVNWEAEDNQALADLGATAATETDPAARIELFEAIQESMVETQSPFVVLLQAGRTWAVSSRVENVIPSLAYYFDLASLDVAE